MVDPVAGFPVTFAVDAAGVIGARHIGEMSAEDVAKLTAAARPVTRRVIRPLVLLAALVPVHLGAQLLLLGRVVPAFLVLPLLAVAAYEAADGAADRYAERKHRVGAADRRLRHAQGSDATAARTIERERRLRIAAGGNGYRTIVNPEENAHGHRP